MSRNGAIKYSRKDAEAAVRLGGMARLLNVYICVTIDLKPVNAVQVQIYRYYKHRYYTYSCNSVNKTQYKCILGSSTFQNYEE